MAVTKTQIIKELKRLKEEQIQAKKRQNGTLIKERERQAFEKHSKLGASVVDLCKVLQTQFDNYVKALSDDKEINLNQYCRTIRNRYQNLDDLVNDVMYYAGFQKGDIGAYTSKLNSQVDDMTKEWGKLEVYVRSLPNAKDILAYLNGVGIDLSYLNTVSSKELVVIEIDTNRLFNDKKAV